MSAASIFNTIAQALNNIGFGAGILCLIFIAALSLLLGNKNKKIKEMDTTLANLQNTYNELDNQAKLIVKTDLELHKTQSELDKKITGLYTLHKITRVLSTTMDEQEIFVKISQEYLTELGFDTIIAFLIPSPKSAISLTTIDVKLTIGYDETIRQQLFSEDIINTVFKPVLQEKQVVASFDEKSSATAFEKILKICAINSFVCAPIIIKEGAIGAILVGSESVYSPITLGDKEIVSILAAQIGQTIENAHLFEETWRSHQELETKVTQRTKELSSALEEIKEVTKRKSDFVSAVAHELRTPLTSIKGYAALLSAGKLGEVSPGVKQRLEKINKHSDDLTSLINNILDIARIESGRQEMKIDPIAIKDLVDTLADLLAPQFKERKINFITDIADSITTVYADNGQLRRVFINIIGNAIKYTPADGSITMRVHKKENNIQFDIADTGIGISTENLPKIFEEFYREDTDTNQTIKGTGLGLSLVKYIVEAHKGKIWVMSKLNQGTTFSFTLPAAPQTQKITK